ncbi:MAG: sigma 54-interacting transcriptional regulator, partial [Planctomycetota bacterium]
MSELLLALQRLAQHWRIRGRLAASEEVLREALVLARGVGDRSTEMKALSELGETLLRRGKIAESLTALNRALSLNQGIRSLLDEMTLKIRLSEVLEWVGESGRAARLADEALAQSKTSGASRHRGLALLRAATVEAFGGDGPRSQEMLDEAKEIFQRIGSVPDMARVRLQRAVQFLREGDARGALAETTSLSSSRTGMRGLSLRSKILEARALGARGNPGKGVKFLEPLLGEVERIGSLQIEWAFHETMAVLHGECGATCESDLHRNAAQVIVTELGAGLPGNFASALAARLGRPMTLRFDANGTSLPPAVRTDQCGALPLERGDRARAVLQVCRRFNLKGSQSDLLETILDAALSVFDGKRGFLVLGSRGALEARVSRNFISDDRSEIEISQSITLDVIEKGKALQLANALTDERFGLEQSVHDLGLKSVMCAPLRSSGKIIGGVYLDNPERESAFEEEDLEWLEALADLAGIAIEDGRLFEKVQEQEGLLQESNLGLQEEVRTQTIELADIREQLRVNQRVLRDRFAYANIVGRSEAMERVFDLLDRITDSDLPVVIQGETGTGKELVAKVIHYGGRRKDGPFVGVNVAAVQESLLESELFGHVKGAFTGATRDSAGLIVSANEGSLFLDEIADMTPALQAKLLRALQEEEVRPVGGKTHVPVDVRIICATNVDLASLAQSGRFRNDLFYRLNVLAVTLPPLRDRAGDVPLLATHFLKAALKREGKDPDNLQLSSQSLETLGRFSWPGNVRQLKNLMERIAVFSRVKRISPRHLVDHLEDLRGSLETGHSGRASSTVDFKEARGRFEKDFIVSLLQKCHGNVSGAAREANLDRKYLYKLMKKHDIDPGP